MAPVDEIQAEVMELFRRLSLVLRRNATRRLADLGLTPPLAIALHHLDEPIAMGVLAERLSCDASYVTGLADRLEELGLAERRVDPTDRRVKQLALTEEGRRFRAEARERLYDGAVFLADLDADELEAFARILRKIVDAAERS
ncbi:MAG TPA: MarR family transcriptional regulator [Actinobacteria bacterium]|nr:MarR family transcriptional regulator [Actinomycetota bacterium]